MKYFAYWAVTLVLLFSIYGSFDLSMIDFKNKDVCPKILGIPACYLVFAAFVLTLVAHSFSSVFTSDWWFYGFLAFPLLLALSGTLTELSGKVICPRTAGGTPMCYISLGVCCLLLIFKFIHTSTR